MGKRRPALSPDQLGFTFDPPQLARVEAALAGLEKMTASAVAQALMGDPRNRFEIAAGMSALLHADVSKWMLDGYASEARDEHNISFARFLALIVETQRYDLLDVLLRQIGAMVLVGEEIHTARLGHLKAQKARLDEEIRIVERQVSPIKRGSPGE